MRRLAALSATICLIGPAVADAEASKTKPTTTSLAASFSYSLVSSGSGLGRVHDDALGRGMIVISAPSVGPVVTMYFPAGSVTARYRLAAEVHPDGSSTGNGTIAITGGDGKFSGAEGAGTFTIGQAADGTGHGRTTGQITY